MERLKHILLALAEGKTECLVSIPNFRDVKAEITALDFSNITFQPIKVRFLEKGLQVEETFLEDDAWAEEGQHLAKKMVSYKEDWVSYKNVKL